MTDERVHDGTPKNMPRPNPAGAKQLARLIADGDTITLNTMSPALTLAQ